MQRTIPPSNRCLIEHTRRTTENCLYQTIQFVLLKGYKCYLRVSLHGAHTFKLHSWVSMLSYCHCPGPIHAAPPQVYAMSNNTYMYLSPFETWSTHVRSGAMRSTWWKIQLANVSSIPILNIRIATKPISLSILATRPMI